MKPGHLDFLKNEKVENGIILKYYFDVNTNTCMSEKLYTQNWMLCSICGGTSGLLECMGYIL